MRACVCVRAYVCWTDLSIIGSFARTVNATVHLSRTRAAGLLRKRPLFCVPAPQGQIRFCLWVALDINIHIFTYRLRRNFAFRSDYCILFVLVHKRGVLTGKRYPFNVWVSAREGSPQIRCRDQLVCLPFSMTRSHSVINHELPPSAGPPYTQYTSFCLSPFALSIKSSRHSFFAFISIDTRMYVACSAPGRVQYILYMVK